MSGFSDPIVGGMSTLIRKAISSKNYVAGTTGWSINADGSAEFNNVTVRGPVQVIGSDGSYVYVQTAGGTAEIVLEPPTRPGYTWAPGTIATESDGLSGRADMVITSPQQQGSAGGTSQILLEGGDGATPTSLIQLHATDVYVSGKLTVGGIMLPSYQISGTASVSFTAVTAFSQTVPFGQTLPAPPAIVTGVINSAAGVANGWTVRTDTYTTTSFRLNVSTSGTAQTWASIPVKWTAIGT